MAAVNPDVTTLPNELLPKSMKAFIFMTDGDKFDNEIVNAILYLAEKKGWTAGIIRAVSVEYGVGSLPTVKLEALVPELMK